LELCWEQKREKWFLDISASELQQSNAKMGVPIMPNLGVEPRSPGELQRNSTTEQQFNFNIKHAPGKKTCSLQLTEELDKGQTFHQVKQRCKKNGLLWDLNSGLLNWNMHLATGLHEHVRFEKGDRKTKGSVARYKNVY
jgi:hypothetical protein